jgi:cell division transport system permease protein
VEFFLREAWLGFWRSSLMSFVSVVTVTVVLVVLGIFLMVVVNLNNIVSSISSKMELTVYLEDGLTPANIDEARTKIINLPQVVEVNFISRDKAWDSFRRTFYGRIDLGNFAGENPLPDSFIVKIREIKSIEQLAKNIATIEGVDEVRYGGKLAQRVQAFARVVRIAGLAFVLIMVFATLLIVVNTIRLTVLARQEEINIMQLVGATDSFIRWPFILEGVLMGLAGAVIALTILNVLYGMIVIKLQQALPFWPLVFNEKELIIIYLAVFFAGTFLGMLGGYISVSRSLKLKKISVF